ncbi:MAG: hypothetical protein GX754_12365 [Clostridiaceae bacterium]|nr:hypothetical protein [Clostridiaceae bacterium]
MAKGYLYPPSGQLNQPYNEYSSVSKKQILGKDSIASSVEFYGGNAGESSSATTGKKSPAKQAPVTVPEVTLAGFNPESIIQGVIFSEIIGKPRCLKRRIR